MFWVGGSTKFAHRVSWVIEHDTDIPEGLVVRHSCDKHACCRPSHLSVGTAQENGQDKARGRKYLKLETHKSGLEYRPLGRGEEAPNNKLKKAHILAIRAKAAAGGITHRELAEEYGVAIPTIRSIVQRKTWQFIGDSGEELYPPKPGRVGENHHKTWLTEEQVLEIRRLFAEEGLTYQELGKKFGIADKNVGLIVRRATWRHI